MARLQRIYSCCIFCVSRLEVFFLVRGNGHGSNKTLRGNTRMVWECSMNVGTESKPHCWRQTVFTAITKMTALSQAGEDFRHHFGTSTSLLPEIVGATGQQCVMQLGSRLPSLGMFDATSGIQDFHRFPKGPYWSFHGLSTSP